MKLQPTTIMRLQPIITMKLQPITIMRLQPITIMRLQPITIMRLQPITIMRVLLIITMFGDIIGVLFALKYVGGSGDSKALSVGLGWAIGDSIISNLAEFWMGARGFEFDWKYVRLAIQSNINLPLFLSFVNLVWVWNKTSSKKGNEFDPLLYGILFSYTLLPSIFGILLTLLDPWFVLLFQLLVSGLFFIVVKVLFSHLLPQTFN